MNYITEQDNYILDMYHNNELSEDDILDLYEYGYISEDVLYSISENLTLAKKASFIKKAKRVLKSTGSTLALAGIVPSVVSGPMIAHSAYKYIKRGIENKKNGLNFHKNNIPSKRFNYNKDTVNNYHNLIKNKTKDLKYLSTYHTHV